MQLMLSLACHIAYQDLALFSYGLRDIGNIHRGLFHIVQMLSKEVSPKLNDKITQNKLTVNIFNNSKRPQTTVKISWLDQKNSLSTLLALY
jgi:hypothetical protein